MVLVFNQFVVDKSKNIPKPLVLFVVQKKHIFDRTTNDDAPYRYAFWRFIGQYICVIRFSGRLLMYF